MHGKEVNSPVCNRDCFDCVYPDCVCDEMTVEDTDQARALERDFINPPRTDKQIRKSAYDKEYRKQHRERKCAQERDWYRKNRERVRALQARYYVENRETIRTQQREYRRAKKNGAMAEIVLPEYKTAGCVV